MDIVEHSLLANFFDEVNSLVRNELERQPIKQKQNVSSSEIFEFFTTKIPYKKEDV